jgi:hypothetical protein
MTFNIPPLDAQVGPLLWAQILVLFVVGVFIPLITPRKYMPLDPNVGFQRTAPRDKYVLLVSIIESEGAQLRADGIYSVYGHILFPRLNCTFSVSCPSPCA